MKYRKLPIEIEAREYLNNESTYDLLHWVNKGQHKRGNVNFASWVNGIFTIPTLEGDHVANIGDFIIEGINGEFYPCKPDIFNKTYEVV